MRFVRRVVHEVGDALSGLRRRLDAEPIEIELDVVEQLVVLHLLRVGQATFDELAGAVLAARPTANEQQLRLSLIRFENFRLIRRVLHEDEDLTRPVAFALTRDGRRLRQVVPAEPNARIQTYL